MDISCLVKRFQDAGVDALRVGMGISSVSTAHKDRGCGRAQASAVYNVVSWLSHSVGLILLSSLIQRVGSMSGKIFPTKIEDEPLFFSIDG